MTECERITIYILSFLGLIAIGFLILKFFKWTEKITCQKEGEQNTILGYNIAFDFLAWSVTALVIIISFVLFLIGINKEIASIILGTAIGSVLTRTPSFKEKNK